MNKTGLNIQEDVKLDSIMNLPKYQDILVQNLLSSASGLHYGYKQSFQQDNEPKQSLKRLWDIKSMFQQTFQTLKEDAQYSSSLQHWLHEIDDADSFATTTKKCWG